MQFLNQEGIFRAIPIEGTWGIEEAQSGALAFVMDLAIDYKWDGEKWAEDWRGMDTCIRGYFYVVKKDGGLNETTIKSLVNALGWQGGFDVLADPNAPWAQRAVNITVKKELYNGKDTYKIAWLNPPDDVPQGGRPTISDDRLAHLANLYNPNLRAIQPAQIALPSTTLPTRNQMVAAGAPAGDDIPY